jgi:hypothetical protein
MLQNHREGGDAAYAGQAVDLLAGHESVGWLRDYRPIRLGANFDMSMTPKWRFRQL